MSFHLRVGQRFRVSSMMCQRYEELFGPFYFEVEVLTLYRLQQCTEQPAWGDLMLKYVGPEYNGELERACMTIAIGHHIFIEGLATGYSPDLINGDGMWYLPDIFRRQDLWCWLVGNDVVEFLG